jgi:enamine deaminase RidA (YjgF/YER057c/UK114 family)
MDIEARLVELGLALPAAPSALGSYVPARAQDGLVYTAGQLPMEGGRLIAQGLVGADVDLDTAVLCARMATLNGLAAANAAAGPGGLKGVLKVTGYVASAPGFTDQPKVLNGASDLLVEVFGDGGRHVRAAVGVAALPMGAPVEIEFVFTVR